jgi:hypothetical protein
MGNVCVVSGTSMSAVTSVTLNSASQADVSATDTRVEFTVVRGNNPFGSTTLILHTSAGEAVSASCDFQPSALRAFTTVSGLPWTGRSVLESASAGGAGATASANDLIEYDQNTDTGKAITMNQDGTFVITSATAGVHGFGVQIWDETDSTWGASAFILVDGRQRFIYPSGRDRFATGSWDWTDTSIKFKAVLISDDYQPASSDSVAADISAFRISDVRASISSRTTDGEGVLDAGDAWFPNVTATARLNALVIYESAGTSASSYLLCFTNNFGPAFPDGSNIRINWSNSADNKIAKL